MNVEWIAAPSGNYFAADFAEGLMDGTEVAEARCSREGERHFAVYLYVYTSATGEVCVEACLPARPEAVFFSTAPDYGSGRELATTVGIPAALLQGA